MLNPIFWKMVQGQKHPGRWGIVEHQITSIKVLFKTNAKIHNHPGIKLSSSESKTQLVNQRKQNSYRRTHTHTHTYIYVLTQCFCTGTKVIRRKHIIQPTGFGACSSTCCRCGILCIFSYVPWKPAIGIYHYYHYYYYYYCCCMTSRTSPYTQIYIERYINTPLYIVICIWIYTI